MQTLGNHNLAAWRTAIRGAFIVPEHNYDSDRT